MNLLLHPGEIYGGAPSFSFRLVAGSFQTSTIGIQNTIGFQGINGGVFGSSLTKGSISSIPALNQGINRTFTCVINTDNSGAGSKMELLNSTTGSVKNVAGTVVAQYSMWCCRK